MTTPTDQQPQSPPPRRAPHRPGQHGGPPAQPVRPSPFRGLGDRFDTAVSQGLGAVTRRALGPYQTAIVRIGFATTWLVFLLREWPHRRELYGPDSPWGFDLATRFVADNHAFTVLLWSDSVAWFELVYHLAIASCVGLLLGWRTRAMSLLFMVGVLAMQNRSVFMGDGGDNVVHLMALYLVVTRCGQVWSLDARRRARGTGHWADPGGIAVWAVLGLVLLVSVASGKLDSPVWTIFFAGMWLVHAYWWLVERYAGGELRIVSDIVGNVVHNAALLVIMFQVCIIYSAAGWYKIQGSRWQDGTAVYYPLHLDYFAPWPALSDLLTSNGLVIMALSYGTVFVQVVFPFALLNRRAKNVLLFLMIGEHLGIALLLGLPAFSMAMIAMDSVFLPTAFLLWIGSGAQRLTAPLRRLVGLAGEEPAGGAKALTGPVPPQVERAVPGTGGTVPARVPPDHHDNGNGNGSGDADAGAGEGAGDGAHVAGPAAGGEAGATVPSQQPRTGPPPPPAWAKGP